MALREAIFCDVVFFFRNVILLTSVSAEWGRGRGPGRSRMADIKGLIQHSDCAREIDCRVYELVTRITLPVGFPIKTVEHKVH